MWSFPRSGRAQVPQGSLSTLAGHHEGGYVDGSAAEARFRNPMDVAVDSQDNVYVADTDNHCIRKIFAFDGHVETVAGLGGSSGFVDGQALGQARFSYPSGIAVFEDPETGQIWIYVSDTGNHRIRQLDLESGIVTCIAGECDRGTLTETLAQVCFVCVVYMDRALRNI